MRPGSKGWIMFMQKLYRFSWMFLTVGLLHRFMSSVIEDESFSTTLVWASRIMMYPSVFIISSIFLLSVFEPVRSPLNWSRVYPALKGKNDRK